MKKIIQVIMAGCLLVILYSCNKNSEETTQDTGFTMVTYTNPTDPALFKVTYEDGTTVIFLGVKDAAGMPQKVHYVNVTYPDVPGEFLLSIDDNNQPVRQLTPNGTVFEYQVKGDSVLRLTVISPDGDIQVSIPIDLKGTGKSAQAMPGNTTGIARTGLRSEPVFISAQELNAGPYKMVADNAMIFHVVKCGMDVTNATVVMKVSPALGVSTFNCTHIGNGFYSTSVPKSGEPPANTDQACEKIANQIMDVCTAYGFLSQIFTSQSLQTKICEEVASVIDKSYPGSASGEKIKAMCSKHIETLKALCNFADKFEDAQTLAKFCMLSMLFYTEPQGGYSFTVSVSVPGRAVHTPGAQTFDPSNPQTYLVDMGGSFDIVNLRADPPDPGPGQGYTAYADIQCPDPAGTEVTISVVGSDGYTNSSTKTITATGQISLYVPGGAASVKDVVTVQGGGKTQQIVLIF